MKYLREFKQFEDHQQLEIQFDKRKDPIEGKPEHVQLLDAFESFASGTRFKGPFRSEHRDYGHYLDEKTKSKGLDAAKDKEMLELSIDYYEFFKTYPIEDNESYYNRKNINDDLEAWGESLDITGEKLAKLAVDQYLSSDPGSWFSKTGKERFDEFVRDRAEDVVDEHGFLRAIYDLDKDGLLSIYRSIRITPKRDLYKQVTAQYKGLGKFWTFDEDKPESYAGYEGTEYILYGKVRLQDINWVNTYAKNVGNLREEAEIEVNDDAIIRLDKIIRRDNRKQLPLEEPLYVSA